MVSESSLPRAQPENWEKKYQPPIGKSRLVLTVVAYFAWLAFLGYFAAERWFGALH